MNVIDLDVLRPDAEIVKIGGKEIDVSFIPCGIAFELDEIMQDVFAITKESLDNDPAMQKKAFDIGVRLCSAFCKHIYPEMNENWFRSRATSNQVTKFAQAIQKTILENYRQIAEHSKN